MTDCKHVLGTVICCTRRGRGGQLLTKHLCKVKLTSLSHTFGKSRSQYFSLIKGCPIRENYITLLLGITTSPPPPSAWLAWSSVEFREKYQASQVDGGAWQESNIIYRY